MKVRFERQVARLSGTFFRNGRAIWQRCFIGLLCCLLLGSPRAEAQSVADSTKRQRVITRDDRAPVRVRYPAADHLRDLQTGHDYQYDRDAPPPESPVARFFNWLYRKFINFLRSKAYENVWQYVILAAIAGLVIYLLLKAEVLGFLFPKRAQSSGLDYENLAENIHDIDFDAAVAEAIDQQNFRLAIRLRYLQTLKRLNDAGRIAYKPEKTNRQYVYELGNSPLQADFENLTRQFEFIWYGDFPLDEARFATLHNAFRRFSPVSQH